MWNAFKVAFGAMNGIVVALLCWHILNKMALYGAQQQDPAITHMRIIDLPSMLGL